MVMIDIGMPERCGECPCFHAENPMYCQLIKPPDKNKRLAAPYGLPRPDWCPLKEQENEYEKGFNDAMQGKRELMYEGIDGKWHRKDW